VEPEDVNLTEVLFEMTRVGNYVRVNAIDPTTGTEVTMVGAAGAGEETLKRLAARKLAYAIAKRRKASEPGPDGRGSIVV
jgi:hypothetical protein